MANTNLDNYIDSLKDWDVVNYYWFDYKLGNSTPHETTLTPLWATTPEEEQEETIKVTWWDIADQLLDDEINREKSHSNCTWGEVNNFMINFK